MRIIPNTVPTTDRGAESLNDYDEFGPPDKQFEEAGPDARVYRVYMKEAAAFDRKLVDESKDGADVMLVFAGLFSAVVTTFLVQASLGLQQDQTEVLSSLLYELVQIQRASAQGESVDSVPSSSLNPNTPFSPDTISVWVNGLWACSLVASLCVALFAVLVKQWLHHYDSFSSGDVRHRSHRRHYRYLGFERWGVTTITGLLPIIMHVSLALFLIGLVLFYIPLLHPIALAIAAITAVAFLLYFISNILPVFVPQCPYQTPLTHFLEFVITRIYGSLMYFLSSVLAYMYRLLLSTRWQFRRLFSRISVYLPITTSLWPWRKDNPVLPRNTADPVLGSVHRASSLTQQHINRFLCRISSVLQLKIFNVTTNSFHVVWSQVQNTRILSSRSSSWKSFLEPIKERESKEILDRSHELALETLYWLFTASPTPEIHSIVVQALGGLNPDSKPHVEDFFEPEKYNVRAVQRHVLQQSTLQSGDERTVRQGCEGDVERILRSSMYFPRAMSYHGHTLSGGMSDVFTFSPGISVSMWASMTWACYGQLEYSVAGVGHVLLSKVMQEPKMVLHLSQWRIVLREILSSLWCLNEQIRLQFSSFLVLILPALIDAESELAYEWRPTGLWDIATFPRTMPSDSSFWNDIKVTNEPFMTTQSAVSLLPQFLDMKASIAMKMIVFALDSLAHESSTDVANKRVNHKLLPQSLEFLNNILDVKPALVRELYASFPSLCEVLLNHTQLIEIQEDVEREVLIKFRTCFLGLCERVLRPVAVSDSEHPEPNSFELPAPSPPLLLIDMILSFVRPSVTDSDSDHPLRTFRMNRDHTAILYALNIMSYALKSASEHALRMFVRDNWIHFACGWIWLNWDSGSLAQLIDAFFEGLKKYTDTHGNADSDISSYIFQGDNLLLSILMLGFPRTYMRLKSESEVRVARISRLVSLFPDRVEWEDVLRVLKDTLSWIHDPSRTKENFPLKEYLRVFDKQPRTTPAYHRMRFGVDDEMTVEAYLQPILVHSRGGLHHLQRIIKTIENHPGRVQ